MSSGYEWDLHYEDTVDAQIAIGPHIFNKDDVLVRVSDGYEFAVLSRTSLTADIQCCEHHPTRQTDWISFNGPVITINQFSKEYVKRAR